MSARKPVRKQKNLPRLLYSGRLPVKFHVWLFALLYIQLLDFIVQILLDNRQGIYIINATLVIRNPLFSSTHKVHTWSLLCKDMDRACPHGGGE